MEVKLPSFFYVSYYKRLTAQFHTTATLNPMEREFNDH